jgi:chromosome segregation ATPase
MTTLEDDLAELSEALPHLPDEVNGLGQAAHDLEAAAHTLRDNVAQSRQEVTSLLNHVRNTVPGFTVLVEGLEQRLGAALDGVDKAWTEDHGHLDEGEHALGAAAGQVDSARTELMTALHDAATKVDQASAEGDAATDRVEAAARDGREKIHAAAAAVTDQAGQLRAALEKSKSAFEEAGVALLDRFKIFKDNAEFDTGVLIDHVLHRQGQYTSHLEEVEKQFGSQTDALMMTLGARISDQVSQPVGLASENFRIEVERLAADAATRKEAVVKARETLNHSVADLKQAAAPLPAAMEEIHQASLQVTHQP